MKKLLKERLNNVKKTFEDWMDFELEHPFFWYIVTLCSTLYLILASSCILFKKHLDWVDNE